MKDLTFPRYLYNELGDAVLVAEPKDAYGLFNTPLYKRGKDEKPFEAKKEK